MVPPVGVQVLEVTSDPGLRSRATPERPMIGGHPSPVQPEDWGFRVPLTSARRPAYPAIARIESSQTSLCPPLGDNRHPAGGCTS
jgi:hypothetical protein